MPEAFLTNVAHKGALGRVSSFVAAQVSLLREALLADIACECVLACVCSLVEGKGIFVPEALLAKAARVGLPSVVHPPLVACRGILTFEAFGVTLLSGV